METLNVVQMKIDYSGQQTEVDKQVAKLLKKIFPKWRRRDMIIETRSRNQKIGYSDQDPTTRVLVQVLDSGEDWTRRKQEILCNVSLRGYSSSVLGLFLNGYVQVSPPEQIDLEKEGSDSAMLLAGYLGGMHRNLSSCIRGTESSENFQIIRNMLEKMDRPASSLLPDSKTLREELKEVEAMCSKVELGTVFSHNNLTYASIICKHSPVTSYEDLLISNWNSPGGNWIAWDLSTLLIDIVLHRVQFFTAKNFQSRWFRSYLSSFQQTDASHISGLELDSFTSQVHLCCLVYLLREVTKCILVLCNESPSHIGELGEPDEQGYANLIEHKGIRLFNLYRQIKCNLIGIHI